MENPPEPTTSPIPQKDFFQTTRVPIYTSKDFGKSWQAESHNLPNDIQVSFLEKYGTEIIMATDNKGIFISQTNRNGWRSIGNELPEKKINALFIDETNIYAAVYGAGIYRTENEGAYWTTLNYNLTGDQLKIQTIYIKDNQVFIGTDSGIFKLHKKNKTWSPLFENVQVLSICELDNKLIAGTSRGTLISNDKGNNWNWINQAGAIHYTHIVDDKIVEMYISGDVFLSDNFGKTWKEANYFPKAGSYVYESIQTGAYLILSNNYGIHRSADGGKTWEHIYHTEEKAFFDLLEIDGVIYGGTRGWDEFRKRED